MNKQQLINILNQAGYTCQMGNTKDPEWKRLFIKDSSGLSVARISLYRENVTKYGIKYYNGATRKLVDTLTSEDTYSEYCKVSVRGFITMAQYVELRHATMLEF